MKHTKGPWKDVTPTTMFTSVTWIHSTDNMNPMFGVTGKNFKANAERIVACVNACEGLDNDQLEDDCINKTRADRDMLLLQRDELLAALKDAYANTPDGPCSNRMRDIIQKVESKS